VILDCENILENNLDFEDSFLKEFIIHSFKSEQLESFGFGIIFKEVSTSLFKFYTNNKNRENIENLYDKLVELSENEYSYFDFRNNKKIFFEDIE
jgi:hypothetical protein